MANVFLQRIVVIFATFIVFNIFALWLIAKATQSNVINCYRHNIRLPKPLPIITRAYDSKRMEILPDVYQGSDAPVKGDKNIFFIQGRCNLPPESLTDFLFQRVVPFKHTPLTKRQQCAIEAAARLHRQSNVYVLFASQSFNSKSCSHLSPIMKYKNVYLRNVDLWSYVKGTPIERWFNTEQLFDSCHLHEHIADFLRFLTLWHFGGVCLELDVILQQPIDDFPPNFAALDQQRGFSDSVLALEHDRLGHRIAEYCLYLFEHRWNTERSSTRSILAEVMMNLCETGNYSRMADMDNCKTFHFYDARSFQGVSSDEWYKIFDKNFTADMADRIRDTYALRIWDKFSSKFYGSRATEMSLYDVVANNSCPLTYSQ